MTGNSRVIEAKTAQHFETLAPSYALERLSQSVFGKLMRSGRARNQVEDSLPDLIELVQTETTPFLQERLRDHRRLHDSTIAQGHPVPFSNTRAALSR